MNDAALAVQEWIAKSGLGKNWRDFRIDRGAAVAFFDGAVPIRFVTVWVNEFGGELADFGFGLL